MLILVKRKGYDELDLLWYISEIMAFQDPLSPSVARAKERVRNVLVGILSSVPELAFLVIMSKVVGGVFGNALMFFATVQVLVFLLALIVVVWLYLVSGEPAGQAG